MLWAKDFLGSSFTWMSSKTWNFDSLYLESHMYAGSLHLYDVKNKQILWFTCNKRIKLQYDANL